MKLVRWAILGPGKIAHKFAAAFEHVPDAKLYAVASQDEARGKAFAGKYNIPKVYNRYEDLAADPDVDIIYIATPHSFHAADTIMCLQHKKAVLCEKPLATGFARALEMVHAARTHNTFLMEGMWSRFFPAIIKTVELIGEGVIGDVKFLRADFGFVAPYDAEGRLFNLSLGGGAQLDVGVYPMFLALLLSGKPEKIQAIARLARTGADETTSVQLQFNSGTIAHILSSTVTDTPKQAEILGAKGGITIATPWHKSQKVTLKLNSGETKTFEFPYGGNGFEYELQAVTNCILLGQKECDLMSLDFSLMMAEVADEILRQCGIVYPI